MQISKTYKQTNKHAKETNKHVKQINKRRKKKVLTNFFCKRLMKVGDVSIVPRLA